MLEDRVGLVCSVVGRPSEQREQQGVLDGDCVVEGRLVGRGVCQGLEVLGGQLLPGHPEIPRVPIKLLQEVHVSKMIE